jgi:hypothetical protein
LRGGRDPGEGTGRRSSPAISHTRVTDGLAQDLVVHVVLHEGDNSNRGLLGWIEFNFIAIRDRACGDDSKVDTGATSRRERTRELVIIRPYAKLEARFERLRDLPFPRARADRPGRRRRGSLLRW